MFHQYNTFEYNTSQYNADAFFLNLSCADTITESDTRVETPTKALSDAVASATAITMSMQSIIPNTVTLVDIVTKQVTNKGLSNRIRMSDWISIKQNPQTEIWG